MKNDIALEITIPNQTRYLSMIGRIGENMAKEIEASEGEREALAMQLTTVLTEALVNAIKHANCADPDKEIQICINISGKELAIRVYDSGCGFDLNSVPTPGCDANALEETGRGIFIIRSLMDSVEYKRANGGNVLEMKKCLP